MRNIALLLLALWALAVLSGLFEHGLTVARLMLIAPFYALASAPDGIMLGISTLGVRYWLGLFVSAALVVSGLF
jgi:hypothetical protein